MESMEFSSFEPGPPHVNIHDLERWATLAAASAVMVYGFTRRSLPGMCLAFAATPIAYRGVVGKWPFANGHADDTKSALSGDKGIHVIESIRLETPVDEVYRFWRQLENLPRVLTHLERVTDLGNGQSHWIARGPGGLGVEWGAEIINEVENKVIGWRSLPGSDVVTAGSVTFSQVRGGRGTQLTVNLQYSPPAGRPGALLARVFGTEPAQTIREDLRHLKHMLEAGEIPRVHPDESERGR
jgi:uncharacterized membrane protein